MKFTFDRQLAIADPNGPSSLLYNLESTDAVDDTTVVFHLKTPNDQVFPQILSSPVGPIVDEEVFSATELTPAQEIVDGDAFAGQYSITDYSENELIQYEAFDDYDGLLGAATTSSITAQYFTDETSLKLAVQEGDVDVAFRSLSPTDLADLRDDDNVTVYDGPGGEIRYMVFNFNTQPFGAETPEADPAKALAVRQAIADVIDRTALSEEVYNGTYTPLYSYVPDGLTGANEALKALYGDGNGAPDVEKATATLQQAGVSTPVSINLQYSPDHYGASSDEEYALIQSQLEDTGLFDVNLQSTLWDVYSDEYRQGLYPTFQLGWFPDYSDADNYLTPFFLPTTDSDGNPVNGGFFGNGYNDPAVDQMILAQGVEADHDARAGLIEDIQNQVATQLSTLPYLQGAQVAVAGTDVTGVDDHTRRLVQVPLRGSRYRVTRTGCRTIWCGIPSFFHGLLGEGPTHGDSRRKFDKSRHRQEDDGRRRTGMVHPGALLTDHPDRVHPGHARVLPDARGRQPDHRRGRWTFDRGAARRATARSRV